MRVFSMLMFFLVVGCASRPETKKESLTDQKTNATPTAQANDSAGTSERTTPATEVVCKLGKDTRRLEISVPEAGGCELKYTKFEETKSIANGVHGLSYCEGVMGRTKSKLESAGFRCE